jgi:hypothetical protein
MNGSEYTSHKSNISTPTRLCWYPDQRNNEIPENIVTDTQTGRNTSAWNRKTENIPMLRKRNG